MDTQKNMKNLIKLEHYADKLPSVSGNVAKWAAEIILDELTNHKS